MGRTYEEIHAELDEVDAAVVQRGERLKDLEGELEKFGKRIKELEEELAELDGNDVD